ncbi:MAG: aldehyde dehydrogenase family protein [Deltaproteobacteria bacterium]|nr:aldehyde dehydrogenase family protein [Deltaproteobacteria bacterium]
MTATHSSASPTGSTTTPDPIPCVEPATGRALGTVPVTSPDEVRRKIAIARDAQPEWAASSFATRRSVLRHIQRSLLEQADQLCELIVRDAGKTRHNAMVGELWPVSEKIRWTIANGEKHLKPERVSSGLFVHKKATIEYRPLGVIANICPWNYPLQNILGPTIHALFAGNAVVVKPSEHVAFSAQAIAKLVHDALRAHDYPTDLFQVVHGYGETGAALVSGGVDLVVFTGSMGNGRRVLAESAKSITPVILELGGKDAMIVCDDADIEHAAHAALNGSYIAAGQNCLAAERSLVHATIYDRFVERVTELAGALRQGHSLEEPVDVGALVTPQQLAIVEHLVDDAVRKGARAVVGGKKLDRKGNYFAPTVLVDCTPDMRIMQEETFGPVMCVAKVKDDLDAIRIANGTQYGLSATVISKDRKRAKKIADGVVSGSASVNDFGFTYMAQDLPFGGIKGSGFGRLNGRDGLRACTNPKAVLEDRFPLPSAPAKVFPVGTDDYDLVRGVLRTLYGADLTQKVKGLGDLAFTLRAKLGRKK